MIAIAEETPYGPVVVAKPGSRRRLSREQLNRALKASNTLTVVVKGHLAIEALLGLAISEALPVPRRIEIERLGFALKVDLAVGLGLLPDDLRAPYAKINNVRNSFAHGTKTRFERREARELYNAWPPGIQKAGAIRFEDFKTPLDVLRDAIAVAVVLLESTITEMRDNKVRSREWAKLVAEALDQSEEASAARNRYRDTREKRVEGEVAAERERRAAAGEL